MQIKIIIDESTTLLARMAYRTCLLYLLHCAFIVARLLYYTTLQRTSKSKKFYEVRALVDYIMEEIDCMRDILPRKYSQHKIYIQAIVNRKRYLYKTRTLKHKQSGYNLNKSECVCTNYIAVSS